MATQLNTESSKDAERQEQGWNEHAQRTEALRLLICPHRRAIYETDVMATLPEAPEQPGTY